MTEIGTEPPAGDPTGTSGDALSGAGRLTMPLSGRSARVRKTPLIAAGACVQAQCGIREWRVHVLVLALIAAVPSVLAGRVP